MFKVDICTSTDEFSVYVPSVHSGIDSLDNLTNSGHHQPRRQAKGCLCRICVFLSDSPTHSSLSLLSLYVIHSFIKLNFAVPLLLSFFCAHFVLIPPSLEHFHLSIILLEFGSLCLCLCITSLSLSVRVTELTSVCSSGGKYCQ